MKHINQIICGDALKIMHSIPASSIDLVVTSPPYNLKNSTGNGMKTGGGKWESPALMNGYSNHDDNMSHNEYVDWQRQCLSEMMRIIPENGAIFYNHKWRVQGGLLQDRNDIVSGFPVRQLIIWQRSGGINFNDGYFLPTYEVIYLIARPEFKLAKGANAHGDIWTIGQDKDNKHPAPFPEKLVKQIILSTDAKSVLDPFNGSGTTTATAKRLGVEFTGIDISSEYCDIARLRLKDPKCVSRKYEPRQTGMFA